MDAENESTDQAAPGMIGETKMTKVIINDKEFDIDVARSLMDDELCEAIHGTVETEQEFVDAYLKAHLEKYGEEFVIN